MQVVSSLRAWLGAYIAYCIFASAMLLDVCGEQRSGELVRMYARGIV